MPDTPPARHAGDCNRHGDHRLSSRSERERHFGSDVAHVSHVTIPSRSLQPLCYFLGEKVTQKHFHTAAPLGRQYESAFARSRGGYWWWTIRRIRSSQPPPEGRCPRRLWAAPILRKLNYTSDEPEIYDSFNLVIAYHPIPPVFFNFSENWGQLFNSLHKP